MAMHDEHHPPEVRVYGKNAIGSLASETKIITKTEFNKATLFIFHLSHIQQHVLS